VIGEAEDYGRRKWKEARINLAPVEPEDMPQEAPPVEDESQDCDPDGDLPEGY
jgi:hypothetical protein